jgi:hypothetical protein
MEEGGLLVEVQLRLARYHIKKKKKTKKTKGLGAYSKW